MNSQQRSTLSGLTPVIPRMTNNPRTGTNPNYSQNFLAQSKAKSNASKPGSVKPLTNDCDEICRKKFSVFGQITFPILVFISLLILATIIIVFCVKYYKSKVKLSSASLISKPTPLNTPFRVPNSNNSPQMQSNEFTYQFWLFVYPPATNSSSNSLVFIRDSDTYPPRFCVYFSDNGSTLNVASLLPGDYSKIPCQSKQYIDNLQFDQLPDFYLLSSTHQISFHKWFLVSIVGYQNQLVLYINSVPYDSQIKTGNRALQTHSGFIDIAFKPKYNTFDNSYISKLTVYNYRINQSSMSYSQQFGPQ